MFHPPEAPSEPTSFTPAFIAAHPGLIAQFHAAVWAIRSSLVIDEILQITVSQIHQRLALSSCLITAGPSDHWRTLALSTSDSALTPADWQPIATQWGTQAIPDLQAHQLFQGQADPASVEAQGLSLRSALIVPLSQTRLAKFLHLYQCDRNRPWTNAEIQWVRAIAEHSAMALQHTEQAQRDRKQTEERLRLFESVITNANDVVIITEAEPISEPGPRIVYVNEAFTRVTGYRPEEVLQRSPRLLQGPKTDRAQLDKIRQSLIRWEPVRVELMNYHKDGSEFWVDLNIVPIANEDGWFTHWVSIQRDITERKDVEAEVLKALDQARELGELKSRFVAMTSHEFRTPLTTIQTSAELLEYFDCGPEERQELFEQIRNAIQYMVRLLDDVLLIGKVEADRVAFMPLQMDLQQFCYTVIAELDTTLKQQGLASRIQLTFEATHTLVSLDEKLVRQILINLLSNALKYSGPQQIVQLQVEVNPQQVQFRIQDEGIGIPEADQRRLFECFHRANNVGAISGTGLGLAIVKHCVGLHQGTIAVNSVINQGTTFIVTLPLTSRSLSLQEQDSS